jgi:hypothetical protein
VRLLPFPDGTGEHDEPGRAGMLMDAAATSSRLPGQSLESLARERVKNRTVDGDFLPDTARSQLYRLPPVT